MTSKVARVHRAAWVASGQAGSATYYHVRFRSVTGDEMMATVFPERGQTAVYLLPMTLESHEPRPVDAGPYEQELRLIVAGEGSETQRRVRFADLAEEFGVPEVARWYGERLRVPVKIKGRMFTAIYRIERMERTAGGQIILWCRNRKGTMCKIGLAQAHYLMTGERGDGRYGPRERQRRARALDL